MLLDRGPGADGLYSGIAAEVRASAWERCPGCRCDGERKGSDLYIRLEPARSAEGPANQAAG
jgi:hypothetical protein